MGSAAGAGSPKRSEQKSLGGTIKNLEDTKKALAASKIRDVGVKGNAVKDKIGHIKKIDDLVSNISFGVISWRIVPRIRFFAIGK